MTLIVNGVKKVVKRAADESLKIKPRLGKAVKRLKVRGKGFEIPDFKELTTSTYNVDKMVAVYEEKRESIHISHERLFNVVRAHLPMDIGNVYIIVDRYGLIPDVGARVLAVRELAPRHRKAVIGKVTSLGWIKPKEEASLVRLHEAEFSIDIPKFFKRYGDRWKEILDLWICEGLDKDERLVNCFKAAQVPFVKGVPSFWQPYQSHSFICTNTGTGKSTFVELAGQTVGVDLSISGIFGSNIADYSKQVVGSLSGSGWFMIDEIENLAKYEYSRDVMLSLLSYLETGSVERRLKVPVKCNGTKAVWFTSNPSSDDMLESVQKFFGILQGDADTTRLGRRISFFLFGNDYQRIKVEGAVSSVRHIMPRFLHSCFLKYWDKRIEPFLKMARRWSDLAEKEDTSIANTFKAKAVVCPNVSVSRFIKGLGMNTKRVRMSACKILLLEHLNVLVNSGYKACWRDIEPKLKPLYQKLIDYNLKSIDKLTVALSNLEPTEECARKIHEQFPDLGTRSIAEMIDVSHMTVARWLKK